MKMKFENEIIPKKIWIAGGNHNYRLYNYFRHDEIDSEPLKISTKVTLFDF